MANVTDGFKDIFLAGIGALAITGEKAKGVVDQLIEKGEITVEQGKSLNSELKQTAETTVAAVRSDAVEARMKVMTPEQRDEFVRMVTNIAAQQAAPAEAQAVVEDVDAAPQEPQA